MHCIFYFILYQWLTQHLIESSFGRFFSNYLIRTWKQVKQSEETRNTESYSTQPASCTCVRCWLLRLSSSSKLYTANICKWMAALCVCSNMSIPGYASNRNQRTPHDGNVAKDEWLGRILREGIERKVSTIGNLPSREPWQFSRTFPATWRNHMSDVAKTRKNTDPLLDPNSLVPQGWLWGPMLQFINVLWSYASVLNRYYHFRCAPSSRIPRSAELCFGSKGGANLPCRCIHPSQPCGHLSKSVDLTCHVLGPARMLGSVFWKVTKS